MQAPTYKMAANACGEFFVHMYWYDGSVSEVGPFGSGISAAAEIRRQKEIDRENAEADAAYEASFGPEFPRGEFPF